MRKLYIAYGSNLNLTQMAFRCPSATVYATGVLNNWQLVYRGAKTNAHATVRRKRGSSVPVLVWRITEHDERRLDRYEGFPSYYYKANVMVNISGKKRKAMIYIMNDSALPGIPSSHYVDVIRQGYAENNFDMTFFEKSLEFNSYECK